MKTVNKNLVGCCGIYCGACFAYRGTIRQKAVELRDVLNKEKFRKIVTAFGWMGNYSEFSKFLSHLKSLKCEGCGAGGGNPWCNIRKCCQKKVFISCAECSEFSCKKLDWMIRRYNKWNLRNLERIREIGIEKWLKEQEKEVNEGFVTGEVIKGIKPPGRKRK
jgi:hypothetical protein